MKGERTITLDVLSEMIGTGKKNCDEVAIEVVEGEEPDIVIDNVSRDGNKMIISSKCSKRKLYMIIGVVVLVIILILGGVLLLV
jgi:hypothetical protein